jgi:hypothetical protein
MSITVEGGKSVRLKTKGKYCDRDIEVTAEAGGGDDGQLDAFISGTLTNIDSNASKVAAYVFSEVNTLQTVNLPLCTDIGNYAFNRCSLTSINAPKVTNLGIYAFSNCTKLLKVNFPLATYIQRNCFYFGNSLEMADFGVARSIDTNAFYACYWLKALILRYAGGVVSLKNANAFSNCYKLTGTVHAIQNPNGERGYVYVPRAYVDSFPSATNWSSLGFQFRALEDYTVDGTITGELDPNKI